MSEEEKLMERIRALEAENKELAKKLKINRTDELHMRPMITMEMARKYGFRIPTMHSNTAICGSDYMSGEDLGKISLIVRGAIFKKREKRTKEETGKGKRENKKYKAAIRLHEMIDEEYERYIQVMDEILEIIYRNKAFRRTFDNERFSETDDRED